MRAKEEKMSLIAGSIKQILSIKIKTRHDTFTDQYNRIFMVRMCVVSSIVCGVNYFSDKVRCIINEENGLNAGFVGSTCWIRGRFLCIFIVIRISNLF